MEINFNFKSAICTDINQSERLLALGLKKETADCYLFEYNKGKYKVIAESWLDLIADEKYYSQYKDVFFPAWSLDRLLEILPLRVYESLSAWDGSEYDNILDLNLDFDFGLWYKGSERHRKFFDCINLYDSALQAIEWLIKEGYFNKEYLEDQKALEEKCKGVLEYGEEE